MFSADGMSHPIVDFLNVLLKGLAVSLGGAEYSGDVCGAVSASQVEP